MATTQIKWRSLLQMPELDFHPSPPAKLILEDKLVLSLAILTAASGQDRKLVRCNDAGAILVGNSWDNLSVAETDELHPQSAATDTFTATVKNSGVLISSSAYLISVVFVRRSGGDTETILIPPYTMYYFPHQTYSITIATVPATGGTASYVGITAFV